MTGAKETTVKGTDAATYATVQNPQGKPGSGTDGKTGATATAGTDGHKAEGNKDSAGSADGSTHATVAARADGKTGATASARKSVSDGKKADDTKADGATHATADARTGATAGDGKSVSDGKKADDTKADGATHATTNADAATYATPLSKYKVEKNKNGIYYPYVKKGTLSELDISTYGVKVVSLAFLLGGLVLLVTRMIFISVPLSVLGSVAFFSWMYQVLGDAGDFPVMTITDQLLTGATMMGAFFIYTDPVGSASTTRAKIISGILVGFFIVTVRNFGGYPDAVAFGALLANSINPLLDRLIRPIRFGRLGEAA